jgi:hypothetical protein
MLALAATALAGCGGGSHFADRSRPPTPVNVTVFIDNSRISLSPSSVGAGPVVFIVTNQASRAEAVTVKSDGSGGNVASTAPINPQATSQFTVNFQREGRYIVATSTSGSSSAAVAGTAIPPVSLHIGKTRANSNNTLLEP